MEKNIRKLSKKLKKIELTLERENMSKQGFFDGRYKTRSIPSKKIYKRNNKHKSKNY